MNCWILVLLLLCCQGNGRDNGCSGRQNSSDCSCRRRENERERERERQNEECPCRNEARQDNRGDQRAFIPYPGTTCGCEGSNSN